MSYQMELRRRMPEMPAQLSMRVQREWRRAAANPAKLRAVLQGLLAVFGSSLLIMIYRRRKIIGKSVTMGVSTLQKTASNLNDLMFSSTSLASGFTKDLRAYLYGPDGQQPQSLQRLIALLSSEEVQNTVQGTARGLLHAFFEARREVLHQQSSVQDNPMLPVVDKLLSPEGQEYSKAIIKTLARETLSQFLKNSRGGIEPRSTAGGEVSSLLDHHQVAPAGTEMRAAHRPATQNPVLPLVLDKLLSHEGRLLAGATASAAVTAAAKEAVPALCAEIQRNSATGIASGAESKPNPLETVLLWLSDPQHSSQARELLQGIAAESVKSGIQAFVDSSHARNMDLAARLNASRRDSSLVGVNANQTSSHQPGLAGVPAERQTATASPLLGASDSMNSEASGGTQEQADLNPQNPSRPTVALESSTTSTVVHNSVLNRTVDRAKSVAREFDEGQPVSEVRNASSSSALQHIFLAAENQAFRQMVAEIAAVCVREGIHSTIGAFSGVLQQHIPASKLNRLSVVSKQAVISFLVFGATVVLHGLLSALIYTSILCLGWLLFMEGQEVMQDTTHVAKLQSSKSVEVLAKQLTATHKATSPRAGLDLRSAPSD